MIFLYERVAHDVFVREAAERDAFGAAEQLAGLAQATAGAGRQVRLRDVARDDALGAEAEARQEHAHLLAGGVLRFVQDHERVVQRTATHERERRHFDLPALTQLFHPLELEHVVERVVQRAQVRVHFFGQVAWQEAELLAGFDRRARHDDALDLLLHQPRRGHGHRQIRLAGTGRADTENQVMVANGFDVLTLRTALGQDRALARGDDDGLVQ